MVTAKPCPECGQGKHWNCTIETLADDDSMVRCPCLGVGHVQEALKPYAGTSGWSGSDTSRERAETADVDGTTKERQREAMAYISVCGDVGLTVTELRGVTGWHHGQASSVLSVLHKEGRLVRLKERRGKCHVYVLPNQVDGRETQPHGRDRPKVIDAAHIDHQREWSGATFGPGPRTAGVVDHIRKELSEVESDPLDLDEWVDVIILGFDGAWRAGHGSQAIIDAIKAKQAKNEGRRWPSWETASRDLAIEHDRTEEKR